MQPASQSQYLKSGVLLWAQGGARRVDDELEELGNDVPLLLHNGRRGDALSVLHVRTVKEERKESYREALELAAFLFQLQNAQVGLLRDEVGRSRLQEILGFQRVPDLRNEH